MLASAYWVSDPPKMDHPSTDIRQYPGNLTNGLEVAHETNKVYYFGMDMLYYFMSSIICIQGR